MAFSYTVNDDGVEEFLGRKKVVTGTFTNASGSTGGDIKTGLRRVLSFKLQHTGSAVVASAPVVNETMPLDGGDVTIVTVADADGTWEALGE